jgi:glutamate 5-kinase
MARYSAAFATQGVQAGQILLTADDLMRRAHYRNAQRTLSRLLELGILPVVNENDTVATDEIRFGDNDRLAALVAHVIRAAR